MSIERKNVINGKLEITPDKSLTTEEIKFIIESKMNHEKLYYIRNFVYIVVVNCLLFDICWINVN